MRPSIENSRDDSCIVDARQPFRSTMESSHSHDNFLGLTYFLNTVEMEYSYCLKIVCVQILVFSMSWVLLILDLISVMKFLLTSHQRFVSVALCFINTFSHSHIIPIPWPWVWRISTTTCSGYSSCSCLLNIIIGLNYSQWSISKY